MIFRGAVRPAARVTAASWWRVRASPACLVSTCVRVIRGGVGIISFPAVVGPLSSLARLRPVSPAAAIFRPVVLAIGLFILVGGGDLNLVFGRFGVD